MPAVSVIIPTFNRSSLVKEAVESVLQQNYSDFEVLVVDDGSTDDTGPVIKQITDDRIKYHYKPNGGQSNARNFGLVLAKGKYVAFLDEDDLWPADYLETMLKHLETNGDYGAVYTRVIVLTPDGQKRELSTPERYRSGWITKYYFDASPCLMPSATCFRKSTWEDIFWDEALKRSPDYDVFLRISTKTQFLFVPDTFVIKRSQPDSLSSTFNPVGPIDGAQVLERFYFHLGGDKHVSLKLAKRKISHRYRKAAKVADALKNRQIAIELFKKAIRYKPLDGRLYTDMLTVLLKSRKSETTPDWQMPEPLPPYITAFGEKLL